MFRRFVSWFTAAREVAMADECKVLLQGDAGLGWAVACSRIGSAHLRTGQPCQDAYALWSGAIAGEACVVAAVADGHGDERHDQSQIGSALAVRAAVDELVALQTYFGGANRLHEFVNSFKMDFPRRLGRRWRDSVKEDAKRRLPETISEAGDGRDLFIRYGTTLLVAVATSNSLLMGQLGDGQVMLVRPGGVVESPFMSANEDVGVHTDSLCSSEAYRRWRTIASDRSKGGLVLLATDGLVNAFSDDAAMEVFARSINDRIEEFGLRRVAASLPEWLDRYSREGSGDDMTLALLMMPGTPQEGEPQQSAIGVAVDNTNEQSEGEGHVAAGRTTDTCGDVQADVGRKGQTG